VYEVNIGALTLKLYVLLMLKLIITFPAEGKHGDVEEEEEVEEVEEEVEEVEGRDTDICDIISRVNNFNFYFFFLTQIL